MTYEKTDKKAKQAHSGRSLPNRPTKLGAEKLNPEEQRRRFIEAAREAGASEDEAAFDVALKKIARAKTGGKGA